MYKLSWSTQYLRGHGPCASSLCGHLFKTKQSSNTRDLIFPSYFANKLIFQSLVGFILYSMDITHCFLKIKRWNIWNRNCWQTKMAENTQDAMLRKGVGLGQAEWETARSLCLSVWLWQVHFTRSHRLGYDARLWYQLAMWPQGSYFTSLDLKFLISEMREIELNHGWQTVSS